MPEEPGHGTPVLAQTVIDTVDARGAAEFYRLLLGLDYRPGDEPPAKGQPDENGQDWLVLSFPGGGRALAFQQVSRVPRSTWPDDAVPQQLHLDMTVGSVAELDATHRHAIDLGAELLLDRSDDEDEPLRVYADLDGHPFCVFVAS